MAVMDGSGALETFLAKAMHAHQTGDLVAAQTMYKTFLKAVPDHAEALHLLGVTWCQLNEPEKGLSFLKQAVAKMPGHADAHNSLGNALRALGRHRDALGEYDKAIALMAGAPPMQAAVVHYNRGAALAGLVRHDEAIQSYRQALALRPGYAEAHNNLGNSSGALARHAEAITEYEEALKLMPDYAEAHTNLGVTLGALGRHDEALACHDRALSIQPNLARAHCNRGDTLATLRRYAEAIASYELALAIDANYIDAHSHIGVALTAVNRHHEAIAHFEIALKINRSDADLHINYGAALNAQNRPEQAIVRYDKALALKPDYALAEWNKCLALLVQGKYAQGFKLHEKRFASGAVPALPFVDLPLWLGRENLTGRNLLIQSEQGLGDAIQMLRYVPSLEAAGATCWLQMAPPLAALVQRSFPLAHVLADGAVPQEADCRIPIMSLPLAMHIAAESNIQRTAPYLRTDPELATQWASQLATARASQVGLVWRGSAAHSNDHNRSMELAQFAPVLARDDIQFVTLQKDLTDAEIAILARYPNVTILDRDIDTTAAIMVNLDSVISVDSALAHLAAALGRPTRVLLAWHADWRWLQARSDSPWYPTVTLHRQPAAGDWASVVNALATTL